MTPAKSYQVQPCRTFKYFIPDKIAGEADVFDCFVCEVGSGPGSLTRSVLHAGARHVAAVEIDRRFIPALEVMHGGYNQVYFSCS